MDFNENQLEAINTINGNLAITAVAGSGKTSVLTYRILNMIDNHNINPQDILAITFSKKAKENMEERLNKLTPFSNRINIETFHSLALKIIQSAYGNTYKVWTTQWEKENCIGDICVDLGLCAKEDTPYNEIMIFIAKQKTNMLKPDDELIYSNHLPFNNDNMKQIYKKYEEHKNSNNLIEFDDFLNMACDIFHDDKGLLNRYQNKFQYILVDEMQDISKNQYEMIESIAKANNNLFIVGDLLQCWHGDNVVKLQDNINKTIKDLKKGDNVECVFCGNIEYHPITNISQKTVEKTIEITTESGFSIKTSLNHKIFVSYPQYDNCEKYLYLMYRKDKGFRIGTSLGGKRQSLLSRTATEHPERMWILGLYDTLQELSYYEEYYSLKYQITKIPYRNYGRELRMSQHEIDNIFKAYGNNGFELLRDFEMDFNYPNYMPQNKNINTTKNCYKFTTVSLSTTPNYIKVNYEHNKKVIKKTFSNFKDAYVFADDLRNQLGADNISEKFSIGNGIILRPVNATNVMAGMDIIVNNNGNIKLDKVSSVNIINKAVIVYNIEIEKTGNMVANNILSHNCIYSFRGGQSKYMSDFDKEWDNVKVINLNKNYRCSSDIVDVANEFAKFIPESQHRNYALTVADKPYYKKPIFTEYVDSYIEGNAIANKIKKMCLNGYKYKDFAILGRTNAQLQKLETTLHNNGVSFGIVDGRLFTEQPEIQLLLSYLKLSIDTNDNDSFRYLYNKPLRWLSKKFLQEVEAKTNSRNRSLYDAMFMIDRRNWRFKNGIDEIHDVINKLQNKRFKNVGEMIKYLRSTLLIDEFVSKGNIGDDGMSEQTDNMDSFQDICNEYKTIRELLSYLDELNKSMSSNVSDKVKLMTIHKSKGLEFPVVFIVGCSDGLLPHFKTTDINDEKRLMYVAITRAEKELYFSSAKLYNDRILGVSPFISNMGNTIEKTKYKEKN